MSGGFYRSEPPLVGYPIESGIKLLDGGHRTLAALRAGLGFVPVWLVSGEDSPMPMDRSVNAFIRCMRGHHSV